MSIRSQIDRINSNIAAAYTACSEKGATMPVTENSDNLAGTIAGISSLSFEIAAEKPVSNIKTNVIYLIPNSGAQTENIYDEWIYVNNAWELIGSTAVDLSQYAQKSDVDAIDPALDRSDNIFYFTDTTNRTVGGLTLEFLSKSSVKINGTPTGYVYLGIMGGTGDKVGAVVNSADSFSGTYSVRINQSGGTGAALRYGALKAAGTNFADGATVTLEDQYFSFRVIPNKTYTDYIVEVMLTPTEEPEVFHPYKEVLGAVDPVARSRTTADHFVNLCNQVQPQKILTWIDDDTASGTAIQSVMDIAEELGIRCSFASITGNWTTAIIEKLKEAQNKGFHIFSHGHSSHSFWRDTSKTLLDLDGDLALSLSELRQNGFVDSDMIAYPGGVVSARPDITKIARKWCRCGVQDYVSAGGKYITGYGNGRYLINRKIIDKSVHADAAYYTDALDAFSDNDAPWYLFATHSAQTPTTFDADLVKAILQYAMNNGWTIMTLNEAFNYRERYYRIQEMFGLN